MTEEAELEETSASMNMSLDFSAPLSAGASPSSFIFCAFVYSVALGQSFLYTGQGQPLPAGQAPEKQRPGSEAIEATAKLLKKMGYPEVEGPTSFASVLPKIIGAAMKRLKKIEDLKALLQPTATDSQLGAKILVCILTVFPDSF